MRGGVQSEGRGGDRSDLPEPVDQRVIAAIPARVLILLLNRDTNPHHRCSPSSDDASASITAGRSALSGMVVGLQYWIIQETQEVIPVCQPSSFCSLQLSASDMGGRGDIGRLSSQPMRPRRQSPLSVIGDMPAGALIASLSRRLRRFAEGCDLSLSWSATLHH